MTTTHLQSLAARLFVVETQAAAVRDRFELCVLRADAGAFGDVDRASLVELEQAMAIFDRAIGRVVADLGADTRRWMRMVVDSALLCSEGRLADLAARASVADAAGRSPASQRRPTLELAPEPAEQPQTPRSAARGRRLWQLARR